MTSSEQEGSSSPIVDSGVVSGTSEQALTWAVAISHDDDAVLGQKLQEVAERTSDGLEVNWAQFARELRRVLRLGVR